MQELLQVTVQKLLQKIKDGEETPSDYANAIKLLHNNKITVEITEAEAPEGMLDDLPFESGNVTSIKTRQAI